MKFRVKVNYRDGYRRFDMYADMRLRGYESARKLADKITRNGKRAYLVKHGSNEPVYVSGSALS